MENKAVIRMIVLVMAVITISIITVVMTPSETVLPIPPPYESRISSSNDTKAIEIHAEKLTTPWSMDQAEDGRIFFTERPGRIRVISSNGNLVSDPVAYIRVENIGEGGLLGLALHPNFTSNHKLYVYQTYSNKSGLFNKIIMLTEINNTVTDSKIILDGIPGAQFHNGGRIKFGPDGKLYVSTGDAARPKLAQDLNSLAGKILRLNDDGSIPIDNPNKSPIYAYGFRNVQGIGWDVKNRMYAADQGETGNDELNLISPMSNYGWPLSECNSDINFTTPVICFNPAIAPSSILFAHSNKLGYKGDLLMSTLRASHLRLIDLESKNQDNILVGYGRLRDILESRDGSLYVATSNTDGRGIPQQNDDKILRILKP